MFWEERWKEIQMKKENRENTKFMKLLLRWQHITKFLGQKVNMQLDAIN